MPSQMPASISSKAFHLSLAKGSAAAVRMVRCSVDVHTLTGTGAPSAPCAGQDSSTRQQDMHPYASTGVGLGNAPTGAGWQNIPGRCTSLLGSGTIELECACCFLRGTVGQVWSNHWQDTKEDNNATRPSCWLQYNENVLFSTCQMLVPRQFPCVWRRYTAHRT